MAATTPHTTVPFFNLPIELRNIIYDDLLSSEKEVLIKPVRKYLKPNVETLMDGIWLHSPAALTGTCRQAHCEVHDEFLTYALSADLAFVAEAIDFDFRTLDKSLEQVDKDPVRFGPLVNATEAKLVVELTLTNARSVDAKKRGRWLGARRASSVAVRYRVREIGDPNEVEDAVHQLESAMPGASEELTEIVRVVRGYVETERAVAARMGRAEGGVAGDGDEGNGDGGGGR